MTITYQLREPGRNLRYMGVALMRNVTDKVNRDPRCPVFALIIGIDEVQFYLLFLTL
jgi:hypothetical protein